MRRGNGYLWAGAILAAAMGLVILVGFFWTPYDPTAISVGPKFDPPSWQHLLGTDNFGRDILSRIMKGTGTTFAIGAATVAIGAVCGTAIGALTGYFGGIADEILMRLGDTLTAFPSILLALVVISLLGPATSTTSSWRWGWCSSPALPGSPAPPSPACGT